MIDALAEDTSDWVQPLDLKAVETLRNIMGGLTGTRAARSTATTMTSAMSTGATVPGGARTTTPIQANYPPLPYPPVPAKSVASLKASTSAPVVSTRAHPVSAPAPIVFSPPVVSNSHVGDSTPTSPRSQYSMPPSPVNHRQLLTPEPEPEPEIRGAAPRSGEDANGADKDVSMSEPGDVDSSKGVRKRKRGNTVHGASQKVTKKAKPDAQNPKNSSKKASKDKRKGPKASSAPANDEETGADEVANETLSKMNIPEVFVGKKEYLWAENSLATFRRFQGGLRWLNVVQAWFFLEDSRDWKKPGFMLSYNNRPHFVGLWIQRARKPWRPGPQAMEQHEGDFWIWWSGLQPEWRLGDIDLEEDDTSIEDIRRLEKIAPEDEDWEAIRAPGPNGLLSVLAALYFWGRDLEELPDTGFRNKQAREAGYVNWNAAADDVLIVLTALAAKYK